jgi:hypothetical protein
MAEFYRVMRGAMENAKHRWKRRVRMREIATGPGPMALVAVEQRFSTRPAYPRRRTGTGSITVVIFV